MVFPALRGDNDGPTNNFPDPRRRRADTSASCPGICDCGCGCSACAGSPWLLVICGQRKVDVSGVARPGGAQWPIRLSRIAVKRN
jgi:hypothetical protein